MLISLASVKKQNNQKLGIMVRIQDDNYTLTINETKFMLWVLC